MALESISFKQDCYVKPLLSWETEVRELSPRENDQGMEGEKYLQSVKEMWKYNQVWGLGA